MPVQDPQAIPHEELRSGDLAILSRSAVARGTRIGGGPSHHARLTELVRLAGPSAPSSATPHPVTDLTSRTQERAELRRRARRPQTHRQQRSSGSLILLETGSKVLVGPKWDRSRKESRYPSSGGSHLARVISCLPPAGAHEIRFDLCFVPGARHAVAGRWPARPECMSQGRYAFYRTPAAFSRRTSHTIPVPRPVPVKSRVPSGENAITQARPSVGSSDRICSPVSMSCRRTRSGPGSYAPYSKRQVASVRPSGASVMLQPARRGWRNFRRNVPDSTSHTQSHSPSDETIVRPSPLKVAACEGPRVGRSGLLLLRPP